MKRIIIILIAVVISAGCYWAGYANSKRESFWTNYADTLGLAQILHRNDALSENGKVLINKISDFWIYGYFSATKPPRSKELRDRIELGLVSIIEWKQENGYPVGPQEPLVGVREGEIKDGELLTDPMVEHFNAYKDRFDSFIERKKIEIQPGGSINSEAAPLRDIP